MILTVTLNTALDLTYTVDALVRHESHRVSTVTERAGGKGLNVARVLAAVGAPVLATGLLGGRTGERVAELLDVPHDFAPIAGETRRTVVVADGDATGFWEPGPEVTPGEWELFVEHYHSLLPGKTAVALSGSVPRGLPADAYAVLVTAAREAGVPVVLDASGPAFAAALAAGPDVVKPNRDELAEYAPDLYLSVDAGVRMAADRLRKAGAGSVVASLGSRGLIVVDGDGAHKAVPPVISGNPTGAGDACVAALVRALHEGAPDGAEVARDAAALSAAAVLRPEAGDVDPADFARLRADVTVTAI
ncbi:sugar kinase [Actinorhabdospora filicis]|uniref:Sugar kinase n=1 Tax=Actinorhabdospora filicis TaxID=1785913 RepID=A0A9W6SH80_9ACTN|nr:1-phosphofructokinase family hexose kinase [Actinorhabdospora filicis]GLZ77080.1 sugar kinase [Actinorhabdospora filicis]